LAKEHGVLFHTDAVQAFGQVPIDVNEMNIDMLSASGHKLNGPKGIGFLYIRTGIKNRSFVHGGAQERSRRAGTENVPGIAAFGEAVRIGYAHIDENMKKTEDLRGLLISRLEGDSLLSEISPTLPRFHAPHIINLTLPHIKSETMLHFLSSLGIYVSSGSACSSNAHSVSSALTAYGRSEAEADCSIRVSFSHRNTEADVEALCKGLKEGLSRLARTDGGRSEK
jgi:cysteine desulfurase